MNERILYNFPSRERATAFFEVLDNIRQLSASDNYIIVVKLDDDDPLLFEYTKGLKEYPEVYHIVIDSHKSKIQAINNKIHDDGYDILVNLSDDQRFTVKGFDNIIREHCKPDTFVHFPESYKKAACSVMSIMHRDYFNRTGYIYNSAYYSLWADIEATEISKLLGCYVYVPKTIFKHIHYSTGIPKDALYVRNNTYKKDRIVYLQRRERNFDLPFPKTPYLLIKLATRGRWRQFFDVIDNLYATVKTNQFKIVVSADYDDVEINSPEVREWVKRYPNVELHYGYNKSKIEAINANFNPDTKWNWVINMSDDMLFVEYGWDYKMLEDIRKIWSEGWDWFAHFNDNYVGDKLPTMSIMGREYYDRFSYIYYPGYKSVSCDAEAMYVSQLLGKHHYFDSVYFSHEHPANTKSPSDYIYRRNHQFGEADTKLYFDRLKRLFDVENPIMIPEIIRQYL